jgi:DNA-binding NarL/FixJ family response regulator
MLVEDEPLWQYAIAGLLATTAQRTAGEQYRLVATADNFDDALAAYEAQQPEFVLLDWRIRGLQDGLAVGHALLARGVAPHQIVLVSGSEQSLIPANPFGYVPKARLADELLTCLDEMSLLLDTAPLQQTET